MKISNTCKNVIIIIIALSLILVGIASFFIKELAPFIKGIILGSGFSILKIILIEKTIDKAIDMPKEKAVSYSRFHYTLRYFLTAFVLIIALLRKNDISFVAVAFGLIILRPALYISNFKRHSI